MLLFRFLFLILEVLLLKKNLIVKKFIPVVGVLLFFITIGNAQPYYFRHYQVENGLSHNTVFCSTQDKNGFLWFGTKDGLNRFDGYRFKSFNVLNGEKESLRRDFILSLATDPRGTLWVGTQKGLYYYQPEKEIFIPFLDSTHSINDIFFEKTGRLWFTADNTLNSYNFTTKHSISFPSENFFSITSMCETGDGTMWFSTTDGHLQKFNTITHTFKAFDVFKHSPRAESRAIQKIAFDKRGIIVIGTSNQGIKEFSLEKMDYKDCLIYNPDKTTIFVRDILMVSEQQTWFATESGIFIRDNISGKFSNLKKKYLDPYSLSDNAIYTLYKDSEGGIWAGTYFGGLNYYPKQYSTFQKFFPDYSKNSISGNAVREICEDNNGNIWIGTEDAGLNKLNPPTGVVTHFEPTGKSGSISYYNIHGLMVDKNELWIGTFQHGLDVMDIKTGKVKKHYSAGGGPYSLVHNFIISLLKTRSGEIYIGTAEGVCQYNKKGDNFLSLKGVAEGSFISCMAEDQEGTLWIGTHNRGLFYFNPHTHITGHFQNKPGDENSLTNNFINSLYQDSYGNMWIATEGGGLCCLERLNKKFKRYTTKNGFPSNFLFKVLEDNKKTLWITSSKGLVNFDVKNNKVSVFTRANGLLNDQFNYNSGYKDNKGNLYFGSVQGMIKFNPDEFRSNRFISPVYITGLQIQNKEIEVTKDSGVLKKSILFTDKITLPYDQSSFSIDFAALSYTSPQMTKYSYFMEGLDKEWTFLKSNRKVYFTNLKPGTYTFKIKAGINGTWNSPVKQLTFVITPPFWATFWAYILYVFMVTLFIYYLIRSYHHDQENKKGKEIFKAKMEFFTNIAHEIKTPLTLIKGPLENLKEMIADIPEVKEEVVTMERNTDRLINLINQILDFRQTEIKGFSLDFSEVNLNEVLEEAYVAFVPIAKKRNLHYSLELPSYPVHLMADAEALNKIFTNLFSNAVKYSQQEIIAKLIPPNNDDNKIIFEINNDGILIPKNLRKMIFEPFFRVKDINKQKGTGLGLALAKTLVELHNGRIYLKDQEYSRNIFIVELPLALIQDKKQNITETANQIL
jgi:ligand-binding sensor domain-containing protein/two-component sensor histidine kinase